MSFWEFLNWLWGVAYKVLDWFSDVYYTFRDLLGNFWYYLSIVVDGIYTTITGWIDSIYEWVSHQIRYWYDTLTAFIESTADSIWSTITGWIDDLSQWIENLFNLVRTESSMLIQGLSAWVVEQLSYLTVWIIDQVQEIQTSLFTTFQPLLALLGEEGKLLIITDIPFFSRLLILVQDGFKELSDLFQDPLGYIFSKIGDDILDFLGEKIGLALGTEEAELPPPKKWSK